MRWPPRRTLCLLAGLASIGCETPRGGSLSGPDWSDCPVAGRQVDPRPVRALVIALDISASSKVGSGVDLDGDGVTGVLPDAVGDGRGYVGPWSTDADDTVIEAELRSVEALLGHPVIRDAAIGLVAFSGQVNLDGVQYGLRADDAYVAAELPADRHALQRAIEAIRLQGPRGATNFEAALDLARAEHGRAERNGEGRRVVLLVTDGVPTLPYGLGTAEDPEDLAAAKRAALALFAAGIELHAITFAPAGLEPAHLFTDDLAACVGGGHARFPAPGADLGELAAGLLTP